MEKIRVNINTLGSASSELSNTVGRMNGQADKLFEAINTLNGMWEGEAHDVFTASAAQDAERMKVLISKAKEIADKFDEAKKEYTACESEVSDIVNSIRV